MKDNKPRFLPVPDGLTELRRAWQRSLYWRMARQPLAAEPPPTSLVPATPDMIRNEIRAINTETERRGEPYWRNGKEVSKLARQRLKARGFKAPRDLTDDISTDSEFTTKRRKPGQH